MKILINVPCLDHLDAEFVDCLCKLNKPYDTDVCFQQSSLVYDSRNALAQKAVDLESDYVLWLDSDMIFSPDLLIDMLRSMDRLHADVLCGLFFARRPNYDPCMWTKIKLGRTPEENITERMSELPEKPIQIDGCGMAAVLMATDVLKAVIKAYNDAFTPMRGFGEDLSFCIRARNLGYDIWCDPAIKVGHMARTAVTEETYLAWRARLEENNGNTD